MVFLVKKSLSMNSEPGMTLQLHATRSCRSLGAVSKAHGTPVGIGLDAQLRKELSRCHLIFVFRYRWNMSFIHQTELSQCSGWYGTKCEVDALYKEKLDLRTNCQLRIFGELERDQENHLHCPWIQADRLCSSLDRGLSRGFTLCGRHERGRCWLESRSYNCNIQPCF